MTILADDMNANAQRLNLDPAVGATRPPRWSAGSLVDFIYGLLIVFTYAGFRPRFGPGPRTAIIAGLTILRGDHRDLSCGLSLGRDVHAGRVHEGRDLLAHLDIIASLVGGAIYRETCRQ